MREENYIVYHLHTEDSLLDSCTNYKLYVDKAVELGQTAIAFTEHGNTYNWVEKKIYVNKKGLKYIHGVEVYLTETLVEKIRDNYHTVLLAKNYKGLQEINSLVDMSTRRNHFYYSPRITFKEFLNISDNVIKISACLASPLNKARDSKMYEELCRKYDYYEIQPHINSKDQIEYNKYIYELSKKYNKPLIAGTDTHSIDKYKAECRSVLQKSKKIEFTNEDEFDLTYKSYEELVSMFKEQNSLSMEVIHEAVKNTNVMADSVTDFELDTSFKYPKPYDNEEEVLKKRIVEKIKYKLKNNIIKKEDLPSYKESIMEEMRVFKKINMVGFMLFMSELVCWCWDNGIPIGFCRGSVGGSVIAFLTDIIDVDPIKWNTIFSRFCNEDRVEIGDIDLDIPPSKRYLVYEHIIESFGEDNTAYILAIGTISDKGTIDEIGRALSIKWAENTEEYIKLDKKLKNDVNSISDKEERIIAERNRKTRLKALRETIMKRSDNPYHLDIIAGIKEAYGSLKDKIEATEKHIKELSNSDLMKSLETTDKYHYSEDSEEYRLLNEYEITCNSNKNAIKDMNHLQKEKYPDLFYYFEGLNGTAISQSIHPAGIIVSPVTLPDNYGTFWSEGKRILSINMEECHEISLVKYDLLGLNNIEIIDKACGYAGIKYPKAHEINWEDDKVWDDIITNPVGIFQFEGEYAFSLLKDFIPRKINDLSLVNAALRPSGASYRDRLLSRQMNHNPSKLIDELLADNNGFLVFQEDTIKFLQQICGLSGSEADNVRRAIGRKQLDRLQAAMPSILEGYCRMSPQPREVAEQEAKAFLQIIEDSSNYQFGLE